MEAENSNEDVGTGSANGTEKQTQNEDKNDPSIQERMYMKLENIENNLKDLMESFNLMKNKLESILCELDTSSLSNEFREYIPMENKRKQPKVRYRYENLTQELPPVPVRRLMVERKSDKANDAEDEPTCRAKTGEKKKIISSDKGSSLAENLDGIKDDDFYSEDLYVDADYGSKETPADKLTEHEWYHGSISREVAEIKLRIKQNDIGTFLVRNSANSECSFILSMLSNQKDKDGIHIVLHYMIKQDMRKTKYFMSTSRTFATIEGLIASYIENSGGLCCNLSVACPKQLHKITTPIKTTCSLADVPFSDLTLVSKISNEEFFELWKGKHLGKVDVEIRKSKEGNAYMEECLSDAMTLKTLRHERLVVFLGVSSDNGCHYIITELLRESLLNFLTKSPEQPVISLLRIASQIAKGMIYLKSQRCIHLDLAARNILMVDDKNIKIGGFEFVRKIRDDEDDIYILSEDTKFPIRWTPLETVEISIFTLTSDVWSYGILLVELTTKGRTPYPGKSNYKVLDWVESGKRHEQPQSCPDELYTLMLDCWEAEPRERPAFSDIATRLDSMIAELSKD